MYLISDSMNCIKNNVDTLFSKADTMNPDDLKDNFKTLMKEGDKALKQSGKPIFMMYFDYFILKIIYFRCKTSNSQQHA